MNNDPTPPVTVGVGEDAGGEPSDVEATTEPGVALTIDDHADSLPDESMARTLK
jgi:hypothetical protein